MPSIHVAKKAERIRAFLRIFATYTHRSRWHRETAEPEVTVTLLSPPIVLLERRGSV